MADQEVSMLQALALESAPTPVKARSETGSDPAESAFAGLMAQASYPTRNPAASDPDSSREDRSSILDRPSQSPEAPPSSARKEPSANEPPPTDSSSDARNPAKVADNPKDETETPDASPKEASKQVAEAATPPIPPQPPTAAGQVPVQIPGQEVVNTAIPQDLASAQPDVQAAQKAAPPGSPQAPPVEQTLRAEAALKGLHQESQPSAEMPPTAAKPALTELLYLPKGEIETPKLDPGSVKTSQTGSPQLALTEQAESSGDSQPGTDLPKEEVNSGKPIQAAEGNLLKPETFVQVLQSQKHPAPAGETTTAFLAEGAKAAQASSRVEVPAAARPNPVFAQVEGSIRWILQTKSQGAELQLHPESLGRMTIQLRVEGQEVHARLWASEPTSLAILQDHKTFLESSLREQGLTLGSFDLQSGTRGHDAQTSSQEPAAVNVPLHLPTSAILQEIPTLTTLDSAEAHQIEIFA